jgi:uncharacterized SAM-binding protein YcdF (DUF218 family)
VASGRSRVLRWLLPPLIVAFALILLHPLWLAAMGRYLVRAEAPVKAGLIVVPAGDYFGNRVLKACDLMKAGYAPAALVSGPCCYYGRHESDLAIAFAERRGCPADRLISFPNNATNTVDEAAAIVAELRRRNIGSFLVVTSNYHTRRTGRAYARFADPSGFRLVAAPDRYFRPEDWWRDRESQKVVFFEWSKTVATWIGL